MLGAKGTQLERWGKSMANRLFFRISATYGGERFRNIPIMRPEPCYSLVTAHTGAGDENHYSRYTLQIHSFNQSH